MKGNADLVLDVLTAVGLRNQPTFVLNDAELAAMSAQCDGQLNGATRVLILTIGFGVGAALLLRCG